ncbi:MULTISPECIES: hypothetical protein [unclassified Sphingopyxis]|uniref:hypothetical protein n=1 Tax=unclassified Sphingopyxis TaxID=2614943 RepID=UPI00285FABF7|nr:MULTISPECIES: hypothetical protein [unclassified Sphingopyxis]MDR6834271.1 hypothetical protein [Sphingopyxis sp. BE122]MDR7226540.1 hypothetical protein [Sphingopyxis sp. BE259]
MDERNLINEAGEEGGGDDVGGRREPQFKTITDHQIEVFLATLADSCNVRRAAAVAGFAYSAAYQRRRRDPDFADAWQAALDSGYARLEMALVERAILTIETVRDGDSDADAMVVPVVGAMTVAQAIDLMGKHRASIEGGRAKRVRPNSRKRPTADETDAEILRRIDIIARQRAGEGRDAP